jgi:ABC-type bacteriocin/lantibiotic exporter with double-glycine peptidase domain
MDASECGAACLTMILNYYGRKTTLSETRDRCGVGRDGLTALAIVEAARSFGLRTRAISFKDNDFKFVKLPAIVHWEFKHFLVVERWSPNQVDVVDPACGRRRLSAREFDAGFTGVVIMLEPGTQFERRHRTSQISLGDYLKQVVQSPGTIMQIVAASLLLQILGLGLPLLTGLVVDKIIPFGMQNVMTLVGLGMLLLVALQGVISLLRSLLLIYLQARINVEMMLNFFEHLLALPYHFFQQRSSGDLMERLGSNTVIRDTLSNQILSTFLDGSLVIVYLGVLAWRSPIFGCLVLAIGLLQVVLLLSTNYLLLDLERRTLDKRGKSSAYLIEAISGIASLKAAGAEQRSLSHWSNLFFDQLNVSLQRDSVMAILESALGSLRILSPLVLLWFGSLQVLNGSMTVGTMLALNALGLAFITPLASLVSNWQKMQLVGAHFDRIVDVIAAAPEQQIQQVHSPPALSGQIELRNVRFNYDLNGLPVLHNINLLIKPGQKVAIVGRTGSGKSTLAKLLLGLYLPSEGEILYDGFSLRHLNYREVRNQFGVVLQESTIFSGSIRDNIAFNNPSMPMEQVIAAAQAAALHDDIEQMPMKYETFVSEGGSALSGGQRQRLSIARALAHSPAILLLDEATSHLDVVTEQAVEQNLTSLNCTQVIIAHRLSTVRNANMILVINNGEIVEQGSHDQLLAFNGYYSQLIYSQLDKLSL